MARRVSRFTGLAAIHLTAIGAAGAIAPVPAGAQGTDTLTLNVSARIAQSCRIESVGILDFGVIHVDEEHSIDTELTFSCTLGGDHGVTVEIDFGDNAIGTERYLSRNGTTSDIRYMICPQSECDDEWTAPVPHTITYGDPNGSPLSVYARLLPIQAGAEDVAAGDYTDALTVTLSY